MINKIDLLPYRKWLILFLQGLIILGSFAAAFAVRYDFTFPPETMPLIIQLALPLLVVKLTFFWAMGLFRGWWRYVSMPDLIQIVKANFYGSATFIVYVVLVYRMESIPRSVVVLDGLFCFLGISGVRFITRAVREHYLPIGHDVSPFKKRILVYGAGAAGQMIVREARAHPQLKMNIIGFVDDDPQKLKSTFQGLRVMGNKSSIERVVTDYAINEIIIAIPSLGGQSLKDIVKLCHRTSVRVKLLPTVDELKDGSAIIQQARNVDLHDLLGRKPIRLDEAQISHYIHNKRVLVTGAGGTIGSEICRQVARYRPRKLILFENAETPLFNIEQELGQSFPDLTIVPIIGDIRNRSRVNVIFDEQMPQVVFHAAAYKHVPMMEMNPAEAVNNNVQGTRLLADAADACGVEKFVMISTDKAVKPANVMGSTKRIAELYVQSLNTRSATRFVTTRFGNVLGSNGSVIPIFQEQIAKGGPVTVTHPEVTRFFMTIQEASSLVLQAGSMGRGGEIFLFDMGKPIRIKVLAEELIRLSGFVPYKDIDIVYTGLRPGEKLYEELLLEEEGVLPTVHKQICVARSISLPHGELLERIEALIADAKALDFDGIKDNLRELVPEYTPADNRKPAKVIPLTVSAAGQ